MIQFKIRLVLKLVVDRLSWPAGEQVLWRRDRLHES